MRWGGDRRQLAAGAGAVVGALALLLASPGTPEAASADCGENDGNICWENESCVNILFYEQCTTEFKYYRRSADGGGGGGGDASGDDGGPSIVEPGGCTWGKDYIGWEPRGC